MTTFALGYISPQWSITVVLVTTGIYLTVQLLMIRRSRELGSQMTCSLVCEVDVGGCYCDDSHRLAGELPGIPSLAMLVAVAAITPHLMMTRTRKKGQFRAIGGIPDASRLVEFNVQRVIFIIFVIEGFLYGSPVSR